MMHTNLKHLNLTNNSSSNIDGKSKIPIYAKITAKININVVCAVNSLKTLKILVSYETSTSSAKNADKYR